MTLQVVLVGLLAVGAAVKTADYRRSAGTARVFVGLLAAGLFALALGQVISFPLVTQAVDSAGPGLGKLAYNALTIAGLCALLSFFIGIGRPASQVRSTVWRTWALGAAATLLLALLQLATPAQYRSHSLTSPYLSYPTVTAFYIVGNVYFVYVFLLGSYWTRRYAGQSGGAVAAALRIVSAGLLALVVASAVRAARVVEVAIVGNPLLWLNTVTFWVNNLGYILVAVGLSLAGVAQAVATWRWWRLRQRQYEDLAPLWVTLTDAFPEIAQRPAGHQSERPRQRFQRRVIEVRDGLLRLSPQLSTVAGPDILTAGPEAAAAQICDALDSPSAGTPASRDPDRTPVIVGLDDDVETLVAISKAIAQLRTTSEH